MEISVKDLRIGNYIYKFGIDYLGDNPVVDRSDFEVVEVDIEILQNIQDNNGTTDYDYFEHIPLTEEWLLKLGFNPEGSDFTKEFRVHADCYSQLIITIDQKKAMIYMSTPDGDCNNAYLSFPNFVHQLQNLFYSICGDELTIK